MLSLSKFIPLSSAFLCGCIARGPHWSVPCGVSPASVPFARSFAGGDKKKGKKQQAAPVEEKKKSDSKIPINILAGMAFYRAYRVDGKDPEVLPDDQYPDWLWHMLVNFVVQPHE